MAGHQVMKPAGQSREEPCKIAKQSQGASRPYPPVGLSRFIGGKTDQPTMDPRLKG